MTASSSPPSSFPTTEFFNSKRSVEDGVQFAWDATSIGLASACMRKYYYSMIRGLQPKKLSVHLLFGGLYASALEEFYKHRAAGADIDEALRLVVRQTLIASWLYETHEPSEPTRSVPEDSNIRRSPEGRRLGGPRDFDSPAKTRTNLIRTIVWYVEQFAVETPDGLETYHLKTGEPAVELSFTIEASDHIVFCGHLDRVSSMAGKLYIVDQKTTGNTIGTYFFNQFSPDNQMSLYSWAGTQVLHSPVRGVIIDGAQIAVNFTRFERGITTRSKDQLAEWYESTIYQITQFNQNVRREYYPMNLASCGNYGGCPFRSVCGVSPSLRENYIKSDFIDHNWDPLEAR